MLQNSIGEILKYIAFRYTNLGAPSYNYCVDPIELSTLINEIERLKDADGCIIEVGVARGMTTKFLCEHIMREGLNETYYAIDTFSSFTSEDIDHEVNIRKKCHNDFNGFRYNDFKTWVNNFKNYDFVIPVKADCSKFKYKDIKPIKLAFLDVDLYLPTRNALAAIFSALVEGGVIIVDDVAPNERYDGAYQAYMEFCDANGLQPVRVGKRCGIIRKESGALR
ncbi:TylF/MycF/NovP-related O-methyltransferase [Sphingomonas cavernae]|nr:TylF/MycF/NovP-related O-methyltransferase [Sphingomonas cavernae]